MLELTTTGYFRLKAGESDLNVLPIVSLSSQEQETLVACLDSLRVFLRLCDDSGEGRRRCWSQTIPQHLRYLLHVLYVKIMLQIFDLI
ncbi:unnamed protein product [Malus baccata var. baccata]